MLPGSHRAEVEAALVQGRALSLGNSLPLPREQLRTQAGSQAQLETCRKSLHQEAVLTLVNFIMLIILECLFCAVPWVLIFL